VGRVVGSTPIYSPAILEPLTKFVVKTNRLWISPGANPFNEQNRSSIALCRNYSTDNKAMADTSPNPNSTAVVRSRNLGSGARGTTGLVQAKCVTFSQHKGHSTNGTMLGRFYLFLMIDKGILTRSISAGTDFRGWGKKWIDCEERLFAAAS
jgi:hypothetical protein